MRGRVTKCRICGWWILDSMMMLYSKYPVHTKCKINLEKKKLEKLKVNKNDDDRIE
jgi:hypothetical protein